MSQVTYDSVTRGPFMQGVDYSRPADELGNDELHAMQNWVIGNAGQAMKRNGSAPYSVALNGGTVTITAFGNHKFSASSEQTFAIAGNKFYSDITDATPDDRTNSKTITAGDDNTWSLANAGGPLIGHNGVSGDTIIHWTNPTAGLATLDVDTRFTTARHVEWWDRRAWWANLSAGVNWVWFSGSDLIETYGATDYFIMDDDVIGMRRWQRMLVVHTDSSIVLISPTGIADIPYRKEVVVLAKDEFGGTVSGRSIVNIPGIGHTFIRREGIFAFTGSETLVKLSGKLDGSRYWSSVNKDRLSQSFSQIYPAMSQVWFWLPYGSGQTDMDHVMVLDYRLSAMMGSPVWYGPFEGVTRNCGALIDDKPHFGDYDTGLVFTHDTGAVDDDGTTENAIDGYFDTGQAAPQGDTVDVEWQKARVFFEVKGIHNVTITESSPDIASLQHQVDMGGSYDAIGTFRIGFSAIAGDGETRYSDFALEKGREGSPFKKLKFANGNADEAVVIRRVSLSYTFNGTKKREAS